MKNRVPIIPPNPVCEPHDIELPCHRCETEGRRDNVMLALIYVGVPLLVFVVGVLIK